MRALGGVMAATRPSGPRRTSGRGASASPHPVVNPVSGGAPAPGVSHVSPPLSHHPCFVILPPAQCAYPVIKLVAENPPWWMPAANQAGVQYLYNLIKPGGRL